MVRASWVLNLHWMVAWRALRSLTRAWTSRWSVSSSGSRCFKQERDSTLNSIPPCSTNFRAWGVVELQPLRIRRASGAGNVSYRDAGRACSEPAPYPIRGCPRPPAPRGSPGKLRPPANASDGRSPPSCAAGSPPHDASPPAAHRPGTGCGRPPSGTRSPAAAGIPGRGGRDGRVSANNWVEVSSKQTTGRCGS